MIIMNNENFIGFDKAIHMVWRVGVYCRLSKDDELQGESASISNQRDLLTAYCETQGWEIANIYQDDGYTGLNMDRPGLKKLLKAVEARQVNLILTKDLSRLGRNYLETGHLMEDFFPRNGARYIAMNDGIDTMRDSNDIAPFKNILNEMYSKDISKKVHSSYLLHAKQGKYTGVVPPFGYLKDPEQKGHLIIDQEKATSTPDGGRIQPLCRTDKMRRVWEGSHDTQDQFQESQRGLRLRHLQPFRQAALHTAQGGL